MTEGTHKLGPRFRDQREDHVQDGKPQADAPMPEPDKMEEDYFKAEAVLELEGEQAVWSLVEQRQFEAALLHPSVRQEVEDELAEVALMTSQLPRRARKDTSGPKKKTKLCRREAALQWRAALGGKTAAARLASMVPHSKGARKKVAKHLFKSKLGKLAKSKLKKKVGRKRACHMSIHWPIAG